MKKKNHTAECFVTSNVPLVYADKNGIEREVKDFIVKNIELLTPKERRADPVPAAEPLTPPAQEVFKEREEDDLPF